jgi:ATP-dependent exoDNAse (exonuclease V) beta subunit
MRMPDLILLNPAQKTLPDADARVQALDIRASWIVEAPAGSGKTGLLIQRYLKLMADDSVEAPEQVLAITFTKKAAAEMRDRVLSQLQSAALEEVPAITFDRETRPLALAALERSRAFGWALLDQPARLNIRTIDSVCSEISRSLPLLSGSGGARETVEDAAPLYATAARRTFMQLGDPGDQELHRALRTVLLHRDGNLPECEQLLTEMLQHREQWGALVPLGRQRLDDAFLDARVLPRLELALEQAVCTALAQLAKTVPLSILSQLTTAAAEMAHLDGYKGTTSPIALCAGRHAAPGETAADLEHWRALMHLLVTPSTQSWRKVFHPHVVKFEIAKPDQAYLKSLVEQLHDRDDLLRAICRLGTLPPVKYPPEQWVVAKALFRILNRALAELQLVFAERGEADFAELSLAARTALRHDDGTRDLESASSIHLQHLLVDEMQDTSSSQYELIQMLTRNWDGHSQTVFLVGDPKQSIYIFRQARVERFLATMRSGLLGDLPLGRLRLTANFRSQAALVGEFNADFATIFPTARNLQHPEDVPFVAAVPVRGASPAAGRVWHTATLAGSAERKAQWESDAAAVRRIVEEWQTMPLPANRDAPWKIAVLVRSRTHLAEIVAEFKRGPAIPYRAVDIDPLAERPEVMDLFALTRALLHPADRVAWLAILRAPWCGLTLADLYTLTGADDPAFAERTIMHLLAERGHLLDDDTCKRLARIWPVLQAALAATGRLPLAQTVERTWRSLGGDATLTAAELANAGRYLELLDDLEADAEADVFDTATLTRRLDRLYAAPDLDPAAVELVTIHKAKGLEWDVVIVPALERIAGRDRNRLLSWIELDGSNHEDGAAHILLAPIQSKGGDSGQLNDWIAGIRNAREAAERKRLFYVACTRAQEELHLFAAPTLSAKGEVQRRVGSLLEAAWPAAEPHFATSGEASQPLALAAAAEPVDHAGSAQHPGAPFIAAFRDGRDPAPALLKRLPLSFDPATRSGTGLALRQTRPDPGPAAPRFERPEGSFAARAFGNTVHAFLERIARQLANGDSALAILAALPHWLPRMAAVLRAEGLPPAMVERLAQQTLHALTSTLKDPTGLWLLAPHEGAATEYALTAWSTQRSNIRIDRIFRAGAEPLTPASTHLWIVDYKTTTHGAEGLDAFLTAERAKYAPQLEAYASVLRETKGEPAIRLALYYPVLSKLIWWPAPTSAERPAVAAGNADSLRE